MDKQDKAFLNKFTLVICCLAALGVAFFVLGHIIAQGEYADTTTDPLRHYAMVVRVSPVGEAYVGNVPASALKVASASTKKAPSKPMTGKEIWQGTCAACHQTGVAGAPPIGHKAEWAKHIAKGLPTLKKHALHGYHGPEGFMPPKGGNPSLTNRQVVKAMEYMISQSGGAALIKKKGKAILPPAK